MPYTVYFLRSLGNKLYNGQTNNLATRLQRHKTNGAQYVRGDITFHLVYSENYDTRLEAMRREKQLKGWSRAKKEALIVGDMMLLKNL